MGRELETDRNILVRVVAARSPAQSRPAAGGGAVKLKPYKRDRSGRIPPED
jgi:hypothetical protein